MVFLVAVLPLGAPAQESGVPTVTTNLDVLRLLAHRITQRVADSVNVSGSISCKVQPSESAWHIESGIVSGFSENDWRHTIVDSADYVGVFGIRHGSVEYENPRRLGLIGERIVDRSISLTLTVQLQERKSGTNLILADYTEMVRDTIALSDIERVENSAIPMTRGELQSPGLFSSLVEPIVLLGAIGVAVFLLFHVRS